jgi:UDP-N-acetyl-D-galactosamine dehydrogenase
LPNIVKITSGSTPDIAEKIDILYRKIIKAGTYKASSIIVAEAAKVIENTQRDINIAFINELSIIFNLLNISTNEVLAAASTKWNFLDFKPGLVGGHCISVDPYYLAYKAQKEGYIPEIILAGRRINDSMPKFVVEKCIKLLVAKDIGIKYCKALILGVTFKEDCNDIRNSKVFDIYRELLTYKIDVDLCDPVADEIHVINSYGLNLLKFKELDIQSYNLIIIAVSHKEFNELNFISNNETVVFDVKGNFKKIKADGEL